MAETKAKGTSRAGTIRKAADLEPVIVVMPDQRMAVVRTRGEPAMAAQTAIPALYGSAYRLKFLLKKHGREFKVGPLRARWPNAHRVSKDAWEGAWGLPVPPETTFMPAGPGGVDVRLEDWTYGTVAQVLHLGSYAEEGPTVEALHRFIQDQGYEITGDHEEEYLTTPKAKVQKTIIRYPVRPRRGAALTFL